MYRRITSCPAGNKPLHYVCVRIYSVRNIIRYVNGFPEYMQYHFSNALPKIRTVAIVTTTAPKKIIPRLELYIIATPMNNINASFITQRILSFLS